MKEFAFLEKDDIICNGDLVRDVFYISDSWGPNSKSVDETLQWGKVEMPYWIGKTLGEYLHKNRNYRYPIEIIRMLDPWDKFKIALSKQHNN